MAPLVSVVILNYNGKHFLKTCLRAVFRQSFQRFEVIFVDNASQDGSSDFVKQTFRKELQKKLKLVESKENLGFAGGNNLGVKHASKSSKYIVLLNNDTKVLSGWLSALLDPLQKGARDIATTGPQVYNEKKGTSSRKILRAGITRTLNLCGEIVNRRVAKEERGKETFDVFFKGGVSLAYKRAYFKKPFDDDYFAYAEDIYLGWLSRLKGYRNVAVKSAALVHYSGGTTRKNKELSTFALFHGTKNQIMNFLLFYEWKNIIRILLLFKITQFAHILWDPRRFWLKCKASFWVFGHFPSIMKKRRRIQKQRKISDAELLKLMSCKFFEEDRVHGKGQKVAIRFMNKLFYGYCWLVGIKTIEFYD